LKYRCKSKGDYALNENKKKSPLNKKRAFLIKLKSNYFNNITF
tara:strand:- start:207 stop:335 length:129 start_codon:yes stop_codon:yes gene_type:complete